MVLTSKAPQFIPLSACWSVNALAGVPLGLPHPSGNRLCARLELTRQLFGRASRSHQIDHLSPELRRISGSLTRHQTPPKSTSRVSTKLGQLQFRRSATRRLFPPGGAGSIWRSRRSRPASQSDQLGFRGAVENPARADLGLYLRVRTASQPSSKSCRRVRSIVGMLVSSASAIRLSLHPSPASDTFAFNRMRAFVSKCPARLPLRINASSWARSS